MVGKTGLESGRSTTRASIWGTGPAVVLEESEWVKVGICLCFTSHLLFYRPNSSWSYLIWLYITRKGKEKRDKIGFFFLISGILMFSSKSSTYQCTLVWDSTVPVKHLTGTYQKLWILDWDFVICFQFATNDICKIHS